MISIKRNISFIVEVKKQASSNEKKPNLTDGRLRCVITWQGQRVRLSVNHNINPEYWELSIQRCRAKSYHGKNKTPASTINKDIQKMEELINSIFMRFEEIEKVPTKDEFVIEYDRLTKPDDEDNNIDKSIFPIYKLFIEDGINTGRWRDGTLKKIKTVEKHLMGISSTLTFDDIEESGMAKIINYLSKLPDKDKNTGLTNPTIKKEIVVIKTFIRWAIENGFCDSSRFITLRPKLKSAKKVVVFLDWDELMKVYNYDFGHKKYLNQVRDVFCFCCFTSLRYSDVHNLRKADISDDAITITTIKTDDRLFIELNKYSKSILDKYSGIDFPDGRALPVISNQKMNKYIKEIGQICGLNTPIQISTYKGTTRVDSVLPKYELMSTHTGRRTFICNALNLGISRDIIMKWTGHNDYKAMEPYIDIVDKAKREAMKAFNKTK